MISINILKSGQYGRKKEGKDYLSKK